MLKPILLLFSFAKVEVGEECQVQQSQQPTLQAKATVRPDYRSESLQLQGVSPH